MNQFESGLELIPAFCAFLDMTPTSPKKKKKRRNKQSSAFESPDGKTYLQGSKDEAGGSGTSRFTKHGPASSRWVWLKTQRSEGQTAGFGPCFHLPGQPILESRFFEPQPDYCWPGPNN